MLYLFSLPRICLHQCDHIGKFLKVLGHKFSYKSSPSVLGYIFGYNQTRTLSKNYYGYFYADFENFGFIFFQYLVTL